VLGGYPQYFLLPKNSVLFCKAGGMLAKWLQQRNLLFDGLEYMGLKQSKAVAHLGSYFLIPEDGSDKPSRNVGN